MRRLPLLIALSLLVAAPAAAEVKQATPDTMLLVYEHVVDAPPGAVYEAIGKIAQWWEDSHTWSGNARNLSLDLQAGGCMCERWDKGSVAHARVLLAMPGETLRLDAPFGPLQEMAVSAVLTFAVKPAATGTTLTVTYRVSGNAAHGLDKLAAVVDGVLGAQTARLERFAETGKP